MAATFTDKTLVCVDCHREFVFEAGEQQFFADKGFAHPPKRCPSCRLRKKMRVAGKLSGAPHLQGMEIR